LSTRFVHGQQTPSWQQADENASPKALAKAAKAVMSSLKSPRTVKTPRSALRDLDNAPAVDSPGNFAEFIVWHLNAIDLTGKARNRPRLSQQRHAEQFGVI
jgi:hypothetical protein